MENKVGEIKLHGIYLFAVQLKIAEQEKKRSEN